MALIWYIGVVLEKHKVMSDVEKFGWIALISTIIAALLLFCCTLLRGFSIIASFKSIKRVTTRY